MMDYIDMLHDEVSGKRKERKKPAVFDGVEVSAESDMAAYELTAIGIDVAASISSWIETQPDELDEGETFADRFDGLMIGICDQDKDGEISDDEMDVIELAYNAAAEYFAQKGVADEDIDALINNGDADAAERIIEFLINVAPDGEGAELDEINNFGFDAESDEAAYDATYKRRMVIRNGKKTIIRKRVSGKVRLSSKQKAAIRKAQKKAHSGAARRARLKSMKKRRSAGL